MTTKVLIAEDSATTRRALKAMLRFHDCDIVGEAENGDQAVQMYRKLKPDIVLMDLAMPRKHGIDAIREIIARDPGARIIAVTALYSQERKGEALKAGALAIVDKPFDVPDLIRAIEMACNR